MDELIKLLDDMIKNQKLIYGVLSSVRKKSEEGFEKVTIKPVLIKSEILTQFTYHYKKKVDHSNLVADDSITEINKLFSEYFKQGVLYSTEGDYQILISKKGKIKIIKKSPTRSIVDISHNRKKKYLIEEGEPCSFLTKLGVMDEKGRVYSKKYDKFKQINRFLEMIDDCIPQLNTNKTINIIDFGCGKSYLTFAMYYYFVEKLRLNVNIIGLDLKEDVIEFCNNLAHELEYDKLQFLYGSIKEFKNNREIDMVVSLHACDTATDDALAKAVDWNANVILAVPCCQHELFNKINNPLMDPMIKQGIIKEKLSSLVTDSIRGSILEIMGYSVQMLEFIDMEHTPKNILIRGFKTNKFDKEVVEEYKRFKKFWNVDPYIEIAMGDKLKNRL